MVNNKTSKVFRYNKFTVSFCSIDNKKKTDNFLIVVADEVMIAVNQSTFNLWTLLMGQVTIDTFGSKKILDQNHRYTHFFISKTL